MSDETHNLQKDPPEGSRKVIERELERQAQKTSRDGGGDQERSRQDKAEKGEAGSQ